MGTLRQILKIKPKEDYKKLPEGFKTKWINALRSGEYKQVSGILSKVDTEIEEYSYCCLGVAAKICEIGKEHLLYKGVLEEYDIPLTESAKQWNHIRQRIPVALRENDTLAAQLVEFNDGTDKEIKEKYGIERGTKFNFNQIAAWIEKNL